MKEEYIPVPTECKVCGNESKYFIHYDVTHNNANTWSGWVTEEWICCSECFKQLEILDKCLDMEEPPKI